MEAQVLGDDMKDVVFTSPQNLEATEKKDTNIHKCRECGSVVDFGTKKEDILHALYHHNPREEPPIRSIIDEGNKK